MQATLFKIDGTNKRVTINSFVEARSMVCNFDPNGLAQIIKLGDGNIFLIDEEGKLKNYLINPEATNIAHLNEAIYPHDCIFGDVLLFEDENQFDDLSYE